MTWILLDFVGFRLDWGILRCHFAKRHFGYLNEFKLIELNWPVRSRRRCCPWPTSGTDSARWTDKRRRRRRATLWPRWPRWPRTTPGVHRRSAAPSGAHIGTSKPFDLWPDPSSKVDRNRSTATRRRCRRCRRPATLPTPPRHLPPPLPLPLPPPPPPPPPPMGSAIAASNSIKFLSNYSYSIKLIIIKH